MASRKMHNKATKLVMGDRATMKEIDQVNKDTDAPVTVLGPRHRILNHSMDATRVDSLIVNQGNAKKEKIRKLHIIEDTDPHIKKMLKLMEVRESLK